MATVDSRYIAALGPVKMEVMFLSAVSTADTVTTNIQRPVNAIFQSSNTGGATASPTASVSGKTITLTQASLSAGTATLIVFGF